MVLNVLQTSDHDSHTDEDAQKTALEKSRQVNRELGVFRTAQPHPISQRSEERAPLGLISLGLGPTHLRAWVPRKYVIISDHL